MLRFGIIACTTVLLTALAPDSPRASDTTQFRVDSYRPTKFIDFGWRLEGSADLSSNSGDQSGLFPQGDGGYTWKADSIISENDTRQMTLSSTWQYRCETLDRLFDAELVFGSSYDSRSNGNTKTGFNPPNDEVRAWDEQSYSSCKTETKFAGELRQFLVADLSLSGLLTVSHLYLEEKHEETETVDIDSYSPTLNADIFERRIDHSYRRSVKKHLELSGELLIGWGRIYEGQYAATVLLFVEELGRRGLLISEPPRADLLDLTAMVHSYRLRHVIDSREHRAEALAAVMALMRERGLLDSESAAALFAIEDVWDYYFPAVERKFGWSVRFGFGGRDWYESNHRHTSDDSYVFRQARYRDSADVVDTLNHSFSRTMDAINDSDFWPTEFLILRLECFKPMGTHWQLNSSALVRSYIRKRPHDKDDGDPTYARQNWREIVGDIELRYLRDARTTLLLYSDFGGAQRTTTRFPPSSAASQIPSEDTQSKWSLTVGAVVEYRLALPTSLFVEWSHSRGYSKTETVSGVYRATSHGFELSAGLTHWLF